MKSKRKGILIALIVVLVVAISLVIYGLTRKPNVPVQESAQSTQSISVVTGNVEAGDTATQGAATVSLDITGTTGKPQIVTVNSDKEEIRTLSPVEIKEAESVPRFYSEIEVPGSELKLYGFMDSEGKIQLRAYGSCWELVNNVKQKKQEGFYEAEIIQKTEGVQIKAKSATSAIDDKDADAAVITILSEWMKEIPAEYKPTSITGLYTAYTGNMEQIYRAVASVNGKISLFPAKSNGEIQPGAIPVCVEEEAATLLKEVPTSIRDSSETGYPALIDGTIGKVNSK